jgi:hypothetical protein
VETVAEFIPNVREKFEILQRTAAGHIVVDVGPDVAAVLSLGSSVKCRLVDVDGQMIMGTVSDVYGTMITLDMPRVQASDATVYVVGSMVRDFKMLNHEQLNSIAIGALKAQCSRLCALEAAFAAFQATNN